jgi:hypothetical protein
VGREGRVKAPGRAGVGADGLDPIARDRALGQPAGTVYVEPRRGRPRRPHVEKGILVVRAGVPTRAQQDPSTVRDAPVLGLEGLEVGHGEEVVGIGLRFGGLVDDDRRTHEARRGCRSDILAVATGDPVDRRVEVGADVLADLQDIPGPGGTAGVIAAELATGQAGGVGEGLGELEDRRLLAQGLGEVYDLDRA